MARLTMVDPAKAEGQAKGLLDAVHAKLGVTPNMMRAMAASPAVLEAYLGFSNTLSQGSLKATVRSLIALAVAEANGCDYCLSAHTALGKMAGLETEEMTASRAAASTDMKTAAALRFAQKLAVRRGQVTDADVEAVRQAGYSDGEIGEIIANVALNVFTNYFNVAAQTDVDFPRIVSGTGLAATGA